MIKVLCVKHETRYQREAQIESMRGSLFWSRKLCSQPEAPIKTSDSKEHDKVSVQRLIAMIVE